MQTKLNKIKSFFQMDRDCPMEQPFTFEVLGIKIWLWFCLALTGDEHLQEPHFAAGKTKPQSSWNVACSGQHKGSAMKSPDSWLLSENLCSCDLDNNTVSRVRKLFASTVGIPNALNALKFLRCLHFAPWPCLTTW